MKILKSIGICAAAFGIYFATQILFGMVAGVLLIFAPDPEAALTENIMLINLLASTLSLAVFLAVPLGFRTTPKKAFDIQRPKPLSLPLLVCLGITASLSLNILLNFIPFPDWAWLEYNELVSEPLSQTDFVTVVSVVLMAPVLEEILFRGIFMKQCSGFMPAWLAMLVSAAIFGVAHGNLIQGTYAFLCGALMGFIYLRYRSVTSSMLFHFGFNVTSILLNLLIPEADQDMIVGLLSMAAIPVFALLVALMIFDTQKKKEPVASFCYRGPDSPA